jgi:hypothetical protein
MAPSASPEIIKGRRDHSSDDVEDDKLISKLISGDDISADPAGPDSFSFGDTVGKADDAVDFEDISDDDLPSEEEGPAKSPAADEGEDIHIGGDLLAGMEEDGNEMVDFEDLFGDMEGDFMSDPTAPVGHGEMGDLNGDISFDFTGVTDGGAGAGEADDVFGGMDFTMEPPVQQARVSPEDLAKQYFPDFKPHAILSFSQLFKPKPGTLQTGPQKLPKVCAPTKVHIEMAPDDGVLFNKNSGAHKPAASGRRGVVTIPPPVDEEGEENEDDGAKEEVDPIFERDLEIACEDWDSKLEAAMTTPPPTPPPVTHRFLDDVEEIERRPDKVCRHVASYRVSC